MKYIPTTLTTDEEIKHEFNFHWAWKIWPTSCLILALFAIIARFFGADVIATYTAWIFICLAAFEIIRVLTTEQAVTNKRAIQKVGWIFRKTNEQRLIKTETIEINQSLLGRIFGFGDIKLTATGGSSFVYRTVDNPTEVKKNLEETRNTIEMKVLKSRYTGLTGPAGSVKYDYDTGRLNRVAYDGIEEFE